MTDAPRDLARLCAYDADGELVLREELPLGEYYEELHALIDSEEFRRERGVARVVGELFDVDGTRVQHIDNHYSSTGELARSRILHDDGTVTEIDR